MEAENRENKQKRITAFIAGVIFGAGAVLAVLAFGLSRIDDVAPAKQTATRKTASATSGATSGATSLEEPPLYPLPPPPPLPPPESALSQEPLAQQTEEAEAPVAFEAKLDIDPPVLQPLEVEVMPKGQYKFRLRWSDHDMAEAYEVTWSADSEFTKTKTFLTEETELVINVSKKMDYAARVRALDENRQPLSPFSEVQIAAFPVAPPDRMPASRSKKASKSLPQKKIKRKVATETSAATKKPASVSHEAAIVASTKTTLAPPALVAPEPKSTVVIAEHLAPPIDFRWDTFPGATKYELQLASDADFFRTIETVSLKRARFKSMKPLPEGRLFWRVRTFTKTGVSKWSEPADLEILYK